MLPIRPGVSGCALWAALVASAALAQVGGEPVKHGSGPLSDVSTNVGQESGPVHDYDMSLRSGSSGRLSGNSVRESVTFDVRSGPVRDVYWRLPAGRSAPPVVSNMPIAAAVPPEGEGLPADQDAIAVRINSLSELEYLRLKLEAMEPLPPADAEGNVPSSPLAAAPAMAQDEELEVPEVDQPEVGSDGDVDVPQVDAPEEPYVPKPPPVGEPPEGVEIEIPPTAPPRIP
jgi:hypothetical protein